MAPLLSARPPTKWLEQNMGPSHVKLTVSSHVTLMVLHPMSHGRCYITCHIDCFKSHVALTVSNHMSDLLCHSLLGGFSMRKFSGIENRENRRGKNSLLRFSLLSIPISRYSSCVVYIECLVYVNSKLNSHTIAFQCFCQLYFSWPNFFVFLYLNKVIFLVNVFEI